MPRSLRVRLGQYTHPGPKPVNQDFHGAVVPEGALLETKGVALALADGISSSDVAHIASESAVKGFLTDYYATPETWSTKTSALKVIQGINAWLHMQTRNGASRYDLDRGYVCTFTALVIKGATAHLFHSGDARAYRVVAGGLEQLTEDHRRWISREQSYLSRALGMDEHVEIDYLALTVEVGDTFLLATDGVYEHLAADEIPAILAASDDDLERAAERIVHQALERGSDDNLTLQILRIDALPDSDPAVLREGAESLPFPPELRPGMAFDGYRIERELHHSSRSHVYLAVDLEAQRQVVLKTPSVDLRDDPAYLERFVMEDWVARRIDNPHVVRPWVPARKKHYLYNASEYIDGQSLEQWMKDHPKPDLESVRGIVEQIARGLQALHRQEIVHQDLRPQNVLIDRQGTVKLIDLGSARVAGVSEALPPDRHPHILGTVQYTAPEYFLGEPGSPQSDLYALAVITYQMLSGGHLPYGAQAARATTLAAQHKLRYRPLREHRPDIPAWIDETLRKALQPRPEKRYAELSEFTHDLRNPNPAYLRKDRPPLIERNPLLFWKTLSLVLALTVIALLGREALK